VKTIGLIGGMSWESTAVYYRLLNEGVKTKLGGLHSAKVIIHSLDFAEVARLQHHNRWEELAALLGQAAIQLDQAGADILAIATNTMHCLADTVQSRVKIPLIHIADATAYGIQQAQLQKIALLGTQFTMEGDFYKGYLKTQYDFTVMVPNAPDRELIHSIIYNELCQGLISEDSKQALISIIQQLVNDGAEGVILGCTELPLLIKPSDTQVPLFDTLQLHVQALLHQAMSDAFSLN